MGRRPTLPARPEPVPISGASPHPTCTTQFASRPALAFLSICSLHSTSPRQAVSRRTSVSSSPRYASDTSADGCGIAAAENRAFRQHSYGCSRRRAVALRRTGSFISLPYCSPSSPLCYRGGSLRLPILRPIQVLPSTFGPPQRPRAQADTCLKGWSPPWRLPMAFVMSLKASSRESDRASAAISVPPLVGGTAINPVRSGGTRTRLPRHPPRRL
jgi:hypothetical protein